MARDYVLQRILLAPEWRVLDIGPGTMPLEGANVWYLDRDEAMLAKLPPERVIRADLDHLPLPLSDHEFDFVHCSHVMEHVADPVAFAAELVRIALRGVVVTPHAFKDAIFNFEDPTHRWWFFPPVVPGAPMRAMPIDSNLIRALRVVSVQSAICRVYRTDPQMSDDHATLKRWVDEHEKDMDVVVPWEGELRVEIIR